MFVIHKWFKSRKRWWKITKFIFETLENIGNNNNNKKVSIKRLISKCQKHYNFSVNCLIIGIKNLKVHRIIL